MGPKRKMDEVASKSEPAASVHIPDFEAKQPESGVCTLGTASSRSQAHAECVKAKNRPINPKVYASKTIEALVMTCKVFGTECKQDLVNAKEDEDLQYYLECSQVWQTSEHIERYLVDQITIKFMNNIENIQHEYVTRLCHDMNIEQSSEKFNEVMSEVVLGKLLISYKPQVWLEFYHNGDLPAQWSLHANEDSDEHTDTDDSESESEDEKPPNEEREKEKRHAMNLDYLMRYNVCQMLAFFGFHVQFGLRHFSISMKPGRLFKKWDNIWLKKRHIDPTIPLQPNCIVFEPVKYEFKKK